MKPLDLNFLRLVILRRKGLCVKSKLVAAGIPQRRIAEVSGMSRAKVSKIVNGQVTGVRQQVDLLMAVCRIIGGDLTVRELFGPSAARQAA